MPTFTRSDLKSRINAGIKGKIGVLVDAEATINDAVRSVNTEVDIRSTRRMATLEPGIFDDVLAYPAPVDLKARKLVSISNQAQGGSTYKGFNLVPYENFNDNYSDRELCTVAFDDTSMVRKMLIAAPQDGANAILGTLDSLTGDGGTWAAFGDATNLVADAGNYIRGDASLKYDINAAAGTTAGIVNTALTSADITDYLGTDCSFFTFAYLSDETDVTNFTLRIGADASNYYQMTATVTHVNTAFAAGWNTIRFSPSTKTTVGTVDPTNIVYVALFMTKDVAKVSETTFRFDHIVARNGTVAEIRYYSKYPWQSVGGAWKENSTADDDYINADSDEYELFVQKGIAIAGEEVDEGKASEVAQAKYIGALGTYLRGNPSEALVETVDYASQYYI